MLWGASVFVHTAGLCTALHNASRVNPGSTAPNMRPATAMRRLDKAARATHIPDWEIALRFRR